MFLLNANKNVLKVLQSETITSGSVNICTVRFQFDPEWNDLARVAVFRVGSESVTVLLDENDQCMIPWECTRANDVGKELFAGIYGTKGGEVVLPTIWTSLGTIKRGTTPGAEAIAPTPGLMDQALSKLAAMLTQAEAAAQQARVFAERAQAAAERAEEFGGSSGEDAPGSGEIATDQEVEDAVGDIFGGKPDGSDEEEEPGSDSGSGSGEIASDQEVNDALTDIFG